MMGEGGRLFRPRGRLRLHWRSFVAHPAGYPWRVARLRCSLPFHRLIPSSCSLRHGAKIFPWRDIIDLLPAPLSSFARLDQLAVPLGEDDRLPAGQLVRRRDISNGAVQADRVVMLDVARHDSPSVLKAQGR